MSKSLSAHEQSITKIFSDDYVFKIPGYQRPYAWTPEQAGELFDDLRGFILEGGGTVEEMAPYFLGSIVLIKSESSPDADVVDGQQRLTTLTILLAAIRASVEDKFASEVTPLIYERGSAIRGTKDRFRLTLRDRDADFFQDYVQREDGFDSLLNLNDSLSDSQSNMRANAKLFSRKLDGIEQVDRVRLAQFIVTRCFLVVVATPDLDSAYRIFSVLNSRGLDLSATDILKAQIIGKIQEDRKDVYTQKWEDAEEDLSRDTFGDLFGHIRMIYRKSKPKGTLLKEFNEHVSEVSKPAHFIDAVLLPMAKAYEEISDAAYTSTGDADSVNEHIRWLNRLAFSDWVPPALAFSIRKRQEPESMLQFFRDLERLAYGLLLMKSGINERIERFSRVTQAIESEKDLFAEDSPLQLKPTEKFKVYLQLQGPVYESLAARARSTLLLRLDALLSGGGATYDYPTVTVEHVLPQNPKADSVWVSWIPDLKDRVSLVHQLGNLALLTRRKNSAASNYDFDTKKDAYFSRGGVSPFVLTTQVLDKSTWSAEVIRKRQEDILLKLEQHWRLEGREDPSAPLSVLLS